MSGALDKFTGKPNLGPGENITLEFLVAYGCDRLDEPRLKQPVKVVGRNRKGAIFTTEWTFEAEVTNVKRVACTRPSCEQAVRYEFTIKAFVYLVRRVDVSLFLGPIIASIDRDAPEPAGFDEFPFKTPCICCD